MSRAKTNNYANKIDTNKAPKPLRVKAKVNIKCDKLAPGVSRLAREGNQRKRANEVLQPPYKGSRAMLKVNGMWIRSNLKEHMLHARHKPLVKRYLL